MSGEYDDVISRQRMITTTFRSMKARQPKNPFLKTLAIVGTRRIFLFFCDLVASRRRRRVYLGGYTVDYIESPIHHREEKRKILIIVRTIEAYE